MFSQNHCDRRVFSGLICFKTSPLQSTSVFKVNPATLFSCEAQDMFCGLQNITQLSICMGVCAVYND